MKLKKYGYKIEVEYCSTKGHPCCVQIDVIESNQEIGPYILNLKGPEQIKCDYQQVDRVNSVMLIDHYNSWDSLKAAVDAIIGEAMEWVDDRKKIINKKPKKETYKF